MIINGDNAVELAKLAADSVQLVVTSPPYDDIRSYEGYEFNAAATLAGIYEALEEGGVCCWVVGDRVKDGDRSLTSHRQALLAQELGFKVNDIIIYQKASTPFFRRNAYTPAHEFIYVFVKGGRPRVFNPLTKPAAGAIKIKAQSGKKPDGSHKKVLVEGDADRQIRRTNIWRYAVGSASAPGLAAEDHPAVMPLALAEDCIRSWSRAGELVLDPFNGSGTTCLAAKRLGRRWLGIDCSADYCALAERRLAEEMI